MVKGITIWLLAAGALAAWATDAGAFNRINGVLIRHSDLNAEIELSGVPAADTLVRIVLDVTIEIACHNPQDKTVSFTLERQDATLTNTTRVTSADFTNGKFVLNVVFDLEATECHQRNFIKVPDSELAVRVLATTAWLQCNGREPGADGINDGDPCSEFGGTVETTRPKPIEVLRTECTAGVRDEDGSVPHQELPCTSEVVS